MPLSLTRTESRSGSFNAVGHTFSDWLLQRLVFAATGTFRFVRSFVPFWLASPLLVLLEPLVNVD